MRADLIVVPENPLHNLKTLYGTGFARLDEATLKKFNYRDVNRVLRQVPGVYLVEEEGFGLRPNIGIRGSGTDRNNRITVMEDGVLIAPAPYAAPSAYYFPTMARMHAVEIKKGAASVQAGPRTTGGALNLLSTPIPSETAGELDLAMGSNGSFLGHGWVGTSGENFSGMIEACAGGYDTLDGTEHYFHTFKKNGVIYSCLSDDDDQRQQSV